MDNHILRWYAGQGWLVLSGGADPLSEIRAQALGRISADGGIAYLGLDDDDYDDLIEDMGELGAPTGYLVNIMTEDDETIRQRLQDAAMIFIPDHYRPEALLPALPGAAADGLKSAYERGAIILAEGSSVALLGSKVRVETGEAVNGLGYLEDTFIVSAVESIAESESARMMLSAHVANVAIGVGIGSALVLGPDDHIETWGKSVVTIALGSGAIPEE